MNCSFLFRPSTPPRSLGSVCAALLLVCLTIAPAVAQPGGNCTAYAGTLSGYKPSDCLQENGTAIGGIPNWDAVVPPGYNTIYLLAEGEAGVVQQVRNIPIFDVYADGDYSVHTLVYHPSTFAISAIVTGSSTLAGLNAYFIGGGGTICGSLDMTGTRILVENPEVGVLVPVSDVVCLDGSAVMAVSHNGQHVPEGYQVLYLLVQSAPTIAQTSTTPEFTVTAVGSHAIHALVYDPSTLDLSGLQPGLTTLNHINANLIQGGGGICAALDLSGATVVVEECATPCTAYAGTLTPFKPADCLAEGGTAIGAMPNWDAVVPPGFATAYLLTADDGQTIVQVRNIPIFDVFSEASYTIYTLVYDPATFDPDDIVLNSTTLDAVAAQFAPEGALCGNVDMAGASILVEDPHAAASLTFDDGPVCLEEGQAVIHAVAVGGQHVPQGYATRYLLAQNGVVIATATWPTFTVTEVGTYTVHDLIHYPSTFDEADIVPGLTTLEGINADLVQGGGGICAALGLEGFAVEVIECLQECLADAGTLTHFKPTDCIVDGASAVGGIANGDAVVPDGFATIYLLSEGGVIMATREIAIFDVDHEALYTTHTLVYDPSTFDLAWIVPGTTTVADLADLVGSGAFCASFDATGVSTLVENPAAGGTTAASANACIVDGEATLEAVPDGEAHVPTGYTVRYVLTQGDDQVIMAIGDEPVFTVAALDVFGIHALVANPATLNLSEIVIGTSVLGDLEALLVQAGGSDCGVLDMVGTQFSVNECGSGCGAHAGSLVPFLLETCLENGSVDLVAGEDDAPIVPDGHEVSYLLALNGTVVTSAQQPEFTVTTEGYFTIHTLVYDPATFGPADAQGMTVAAINALFEQGGGNLCAAIDVTGAPTMVVDCEVPCFAFAGSLNGGGSVCLPKDGTAVLTAFPSGDANVPAGYGVVYLLSSGAEQTIHQVAADPSFFVDAPDAWTIHTVVYDPAQWDPTQIVAGNTTCGELVDAFVLGGGEICAGIDLVGATFHVTECPEGPQLGEDIGLTVWPVPAQDQVIVEVVRGAGGTLEGAEVAVFNSRGAQVSGIRAIALANGRWAVDVQSLAPGLYTVRVMGPNGRYTHRFVKSVR
jgi:hypothetical protein